MGTMCSCCYIGKTHDMIEDLRNKRLASMYEDEITDIYEFVIPIQKKLKMRKNKNIKRNIKRIINKNVYKLSVKENRFLKKNKSYYINEFR